MINILDYLERSAANWPDKTAFADETDTCTFSELLMKARAVGSGLAPYDCFGRPVMILMEKSVVTIEMMMGSVCAGGFYVILDAAQPIERLNRIIETLQSRVMIVSSENEELAQKLDFDGTVLSPAQLLETKTDDECLERIRGRMTDVLPLYVLFTSGSTGVPKGVVVSHRSVIDFIGCFTETFGIGPEDVLGNQAPWDFDVSVKDIYSGIFSGARVEILPRKLFSFPMLLIDHLIEREVTSLTWAVSALAIISTLNGLSYKVPEKIRRIMFSGETMPIRCLNYWRSYYPEASFVNLYGPTEITCNCTYYKVDRNFEPGDNLPIGIPFLNETVFLLDEEDKLVTQADTGKKGEICVSGTALALGYYRNWEQTQKAFVQNPLNDAYLEPIYRTGDLGYFNERGEMCFTSRKDFQIKHMGHRIELGEIESALEKVEAVGRSCVLFDEKKNKIVCFYQGMADKKQIASQLKTIIPDFMVPNRFVKLDELPITKNGKIDRKKLKETL